MSSKIAIDARFQKPILLKEALAKLDRVLGACGFFHDRDNPDAGLAEAYLHSFSTGEHIGEFIPWPDPERRFREGDMIDFVYLSRENFGTAYDEGPFPIHLSFMTANTNQDGAVSFVIRTNLWSGSSDRPWWSAAMHLLEQLASRLHEDFDCKHTIIYCDSTAEGSNQPPQIFL